MVLLTLRSPQGLTLGVKTDQGVVDTGLDPAPLFAQGVPGLAQLDTAAKRATTFLDETALQLGPCVPCPGKILCVGLNYRKHAAESGMPEPSQPVLFSKFGNALAASGDEISIGDLAKVDYEAELGLVISQRAKRVSAADALDYVLGYFNANDLSERGLQFVSGQWLVGKSLDGFLPVGPYLVTADEVGDPQALGVRGYLNGELRQDSSTADMIFSVAEIIAYASRYMTLEAGDVIITGTPEGVAFGRQDELYLRPGDVYTVEIDKLGRLQNRLVS